LIAIWAVAVQFFKAMRSGFREPAFRGLFYLTSTIIGSGTVFYRTVEGWSWLDSFYFTVITLTTVGYGDLAPQRALSKLFTVMIILVGIGLLIALIERIAHYVVEDHGARQTKKAEGS
jgi:voltage-gated potassium channel Kch